MSPVTALFSVIHIYWALMRVGAVRSTVAIVADVLQSPGDASLLFSVRFGSRARNRCRLVSMIVMRHNT